MARTTGEERRLLRELRSTQTASTNWKEFPEDFDELTSPDDVDYLLCSDKNGDCRKINPSILPSATNVFHDESLVGMGTSAAPIGINSASYKVRNIKPGTNISITNESNGSYTINANYDLGGLVVVAHDDTLSGDGTDEHPLSVIPDPIDSGELTALTLSTPTITRTNYGEQNKVGFSVIGLPDNLIKQGTNVVVTYDEISRSYTISTSGGGGGGAEYFSSNFIGDGTQQNPIDLSTQLEVRASSLVTDAIASFYSHNIKQGAEFGVKGVVPYFGVFDNESSDYRANRKFDNRIYTPADMDVSTATNNFLIGLLDLDPGSFTVGTDGRIKTQLIQADCNFSNNFTGNGTTTTPIDLAQTIQIQSTFGSPTIKLDSANMHIEMASAETSGNAYVKVWQNGTGNNQNTRILTSKQLATDSITGTESRVIGTLDLDSAYFKVDSTTRKIQWQGASTSVEHDATMFGLGTSASPLSIVQPIASVSPSTIGDDDGFTWRSTSLQGTTPKGSIILGLTQAHPLFIMTENRADVSYVSYITPESLEMSDTTSSDSVAIKADGIRAMDSSGGKKTFDSHIIESITSERVIAAHDLDSSCFQLDATTHKIKVIGDGSGLSAVAHDTSMVGDGTSQSPLSILSDTNTASTVPSGKRFSLAKPDGSTFLSANTHGEVYINNIAFTNNNLTLSGTISRYISGTALSQQLDEWNIPCTDDFDSSCFTIDPTTRKIKTISSGGISSVVTDGVGISGTGTDADPLVWKGMVVEKAAEEEYWYERYQNDGAAGLSFSLPYGKTNYIEYVQFNIQDEIDAASGNGVLLNNIFGLDWDWQTNDDLGGPSSYRSCGWYRNWDGSAQNYIYSIRVCGINQQDWEYGPAYVAIKNLNSITINDVYLWPSWTWESEKWPGLVVSWDKDNCRITFEVDETQVSLENQSLWVLCKNDVDNGTDVARQRKFKLKKDNIEHWEQLIPIVQISTDNSLNAEYYPNSRSYGLSLNPNISAQSITVKRSYTSIAEISDFNNGGSLSLFDAASYENILLSATDSGYFAGIGGTITIQNDSHDKLVIHAKPNIVHNWNSPPYEALHTGMLNDTAWDVDEYGKIIPKTNADEEWFWFNNNNNNKLSLAESFLVHKRDSSGQSAAYISWDGIGIGAYDNGNFDLEKFLKRGEIQSGDLRAVLTVKDFIGESGNGQFSVQGGLMYIEYLDECRVGNNMDNPYVSMRSNAFMFLQNSQNGTAVRVSYDGGVTVGQYMMGSVNIDRQLKAGTYTGLGMVPAFNDFSTDHFALVSNKIQLADQLNFTGDNSHGVIIGAGTSSNGTNLLTVRNTTNWEKYATIQADTQDIRMIVTGNGVGAVAIECDNQYGPSMGIFSSATLAASTARRVIHGMSSFDQSGLPLDIVKYIPAWGDFDQTRFQLVNHKIQTIMPNPISLSDGGTIVNIGASGSTAAMTLQTDSSRMILTTGGLPYSTSWSNNADYVPRIDDFSSNHFEIFDRKIQWKAPQLDEMKEEIKQLKEELASLKAKIESA